MANTGNDFLLTEENDLIIGTNGDIMTTDLYEKLEGYDLTFYEGYIAIRQFIAICFETTIGQYNLFDWNFGASSDLMISSTKINRFEEFTENFKEQLLRDDRIVSVDNVSYEQTGDNSWSIFVSITSINANRSSEFVFPYIAT